MSVFLSHISPDQLELYLLHFLREEEEEAVEIHLLLCEECRQDTMEGEDKIAALRLALRAGERE